MSDERNYSSLNLNKDVIQPQLEKFNNELSLQTRSYGARPGGKGVRIVIGRAGQDDATVDIYFNQDGTSTIHYKLGRNQNLGLAFADRLYDTINPDEFQSVNMTLKGIDRADIVGIVEVLGEDGGKTFHIDRKENNGSVQWKINCEEDSDSLTVTHHQNLKLQIQGRPLTCYRKLVYMLTDILDLAGLELVLSRQDDNATVLVRREVAAEYLKTALPHSFQNLPGITMDLLVSGQCVKLAGPSMPEYSMLLFPELRSLEGAIKSKLAGFGLDPDTHNFGYFFDYTNPGYELKSSFHGHIADVTVRGELDKAYTFFNKHRHGLFHMDSFEEASRKISTVVQLLSLTTEAYGHIDNLYRT